MWPEKGSENKITFDWAEDNKISELQVEWEFSVPCPDKGN